ARATGAVLETVGDCVPADIAEVLSDRRGIYNMTAAGNTSWYGFARAIVEWKLRDGLHEGSLARVVPISSDGYPTAARRPHNSCLSNEKLLRVFGVTLPGWRESLDIVMKEVERAPAGSLLKGSLS